MGLPLDCQLYWGQNIIYHPTQYDLFHSDHRFDVVSAGRRSGKTFIAKRKAIARFLSTPGLYFLGAPTFPQARGIFWSDLKAAIPDYLLSKKPHETTCVMNLKNGTQIEIIGFDAPARFEGRPWTGGIIDESDDLKSNAWPEHIRPALDTIGLKTWVILCGVPNGKRLLFDLSKKPDTDPDWEYFHWKSAEILSAKAIESAMHDLSLLQFKQEYEASFETAEGIVYSDYSSSLNGTIKTIDPDLPLIWTHDFNYTPLSSAIIQELPDPHVLDEIVLTSAVAMNSAVEFCDRYKNHRRKQVVIYGDYSGANGENHGQSSDYKTIEKYLGQNSWEVFRQIRPNPLIKDGQNSLRAQICNAYGERRLKVNVARCRTVDDGLSRTSLKPGSTFQEQDAFYQHITTALRYYSLTRFPVGGLSIIQQTNC